VSKLKETPEPTFFAAFGLAAALALAFFGVRASWIAVVGGDPRSPPSPLSALGFAAALDFLLRVGVLCCVVVER
jgi:hypothetical protein